MKCLCFSDSHNFLHYMRKALNLHKDAEVVFFLGDGLSDLQELYPYYPDKAFFAVKGNCDLSVTAMGRAIKKTDSITLLGKRIVFTHGDLYGVKYGTAGIRKLAMEENADIVLFGHTHESAEIYVPAEENTAEHECPVAKAFYLFNPGSIGSSSATYGIITLNEESEPLFSHGTFV